MLRNLIEFGWGLIAMFALLGSITAIRLWLWERKHR